MRRQSQQRPQQQQLPPIATNGIEVSDYDDVFQEARPSE